MIPELFMMPFLEDFERVVRKERELNLAALGYNQLTVNEYFGGIGIAAHAETHSCFDEGFCSISLLGGITMDFHKPNPERLNAAKEN